MDRGDGLPQHVGISSTLEVALRDTLTRLIRLWIDRGDHAE
jgi:hypothetical protein